MGKKDTAPPAGADVLYSRLIVCEFRDGLVRIEVGSGSHTQGGTIPLRLAMELHHQLGLVIDEALRDRVIVLSPASPPTQN